MTALRERGIVLEICPTSNLLTKALPDEDAVRETFRQFVDNGVVFTIATDGPEMMRTHLRDEFDLLLRIGALDVDEAREANARGHESALPARCAWASGRKPRNTPFGQWSHRQAAGRLRGMSPSPQMAHRPDRAPASSGRADRGGLLERGGRRAAGHLPSYREGALRRPPASSECRADAKIPAAYRALTGDDPLAEDLGAEASAGG